MNSEKIEKTEMEAGTDGLPSGWRLLKAGENRLTREGEPFTLTLSAGEIDRIISHYHSKNAKIPLDGDHFLHHLARSAGLDEGELVAASPYKGGIGTLGYGEVAKKNGDLWITSVEWVPAAQILLSEKQYRYSSPVVQGLDGKSPLRVTSVALTNSPALSDTPSLLAMSELVYTPINPKRQESPMSDPATPASSKDDPKKCVAANDPPEPGEPTIESLTAENTALKAENEKLKEALKAAGGTLDMSDGTVLIQTMKELSAKAAAHDPLVSRIQALELSEENRKLDDLIAKGRKEGRITDASEPGLRKLGFVALTAVMPSLQKVVPDALTGTPKAAPAVLALTEEEKKIAKSCGHTEEAYLAAKKETVKE